MISQSRIVLIDGFFPPYGVSYVETDLLTVGEPEQQRIGLRNLAVKNLLQGNSTEVAPVQTPAA